MVRVLQGSVDSGSTVSGVYIWTVVGITVGYPDDMMLVVENLEELKKRFGAKETYLECKGLRMNMNKTNIFICNIGKVPY